MLCSAATLDGQAVPEGPSFKYGSGPVTVADPETAADSSGNFLATLHIFFSAHRSVVAYDRAGEVRSSFVASGDEFVAAQADVTALAEGDFVVVWLPYSTTPSRYVVWRRWNLDGEPLSEEIVANVDLGPHRTNHPTVRGRPLGDFLVVWDSTVSAGGDDDGRSIQGRRFAPSGVPLSGQFQINTTEAGDQARPAVAVHDDGSFVILWSSDTSPGSDDDGESILARRFANHGAPIGDDFQVNGHTLGNQRRPTVASLPGGGFVVAWDSSSSPGNDDDGFSVQARWFDRAGEPLGPDLQVNRVVEGHQHSPDLGVTSEGLVEVLWDGPDAQRRVFDLMGTPLTAQLPVADNPGGAAVPDLSPDPNGGFVVAWTNAAYPRVGYARRFVWPLFEDGFESGDTSAWASTVP